MTRRIGRDLADRAGLRRNYYVRSRETLPIVPTTIPMDRAWFAGAHRERAARTARDVLDFLHRTMARLQWGHARRPWEMHRVSLRACLRPLRDPDPRDDLAV
jgi:hypothetical protein